MDGVRGPRLVRTVYGEAAAGLLEPGERLLVLARVGEPLNSSPVDFRRAADPHPGPDPRTRPWILGFALLSGGIRWNLQRHNLWQAGTRGTGAPGSLADALRAAFERSAEAPNLVAVTDRRLLLLAGSATGPLRPAAEVPRPAVRDARRRPCGFHVLSRGRVEVTFTDGSMKALALGWARAGRARMFVDALVGRPGAQ